MEFVDYYAALNLTRKANAKQIRKAFLDALENSRTPEQFTLCTDAYGVLRNRYKRARYDRTLGFFMIVQSKKDTYSNGITYKLNSTKPAYGFQKLIQNFKNWIFEKHELDWNEALLTRYGYKLIAAKAAPYLVLRFPQEKEIESFAKYLLQDRVIKMFTESE